MINIAVEGESDREAAASVVRFVGHTVGKVVVAGGASRLDPKIPKYNEAARRSCWVVFRDSDGACPVELRDRLTAAIRERNPLFTLRIAHSMTEAWLMADREGFAQFFRVRPAAVPEHPEEVPHGKRALLTVCGRSRSRALKRDLVTDDGQTGPLYVKRINEYAATHWDVAAAVDRSASLASAVERIRALPG